MKKLLACLLFLCCLNLNPQLYAQQPNYSNLPDTVWVAVTALSAEISPELEAAFVTSAQVSFFKMNGRQKHKIKFMLTNDPVFADIHMQIGDIKLATSADKASSLALTLIGVGAPIALAAAGVPVPIAFYFTPQNRYTASMSFGHYLHGDGFTNQPKILRRVDTGYFSTDKRNEGKIARDFGYWMAYTAKRWNKKHKKALKAYAKRN